MKTRTSIGTVLGAGLALAVAAALTVPTIATSAASTSAIAAPKPSVSAGSIATRTQLGAENLAMKAVEPSAAYHAKARRATSAKAMATLRAKSHKATTTKSVKLASTKKHTRRTQQQRAQAILNRLIRKHPILAAHDGWTRVTVKVGSTPGNNQAVAYYMSGRIILNPHHRAPIRTILNHEVWHVIDWRNNGHIDWGENVPR